MGPTSVALAQGRSQVSSLIGGNKHSGSRSLVPNKNGREAHPDSEAVPGSQKFCGVLRNEPPGRGESESGLNVKKKKKTCRRRECNSEWWK